MAVERAPAALDPVWKAAWREAAAEMRASKTWTRARRRLLTLYIGALRDEQLHRELARKEPSRENPDTGLLVPNPHWLAADRESKRVLAYADALGLTARAQKQLQKQAEEAGAVTDDPYAALDELEPKRKRRTR
jgi:P27 family predicted phage terminase small subunit